MKGRFGLTAETAAEFRRIHGFDPPRPERLPDPSEHRRYTRFYHPTDEQDRAISFTTGTCAGSVEPPGYIMSITTSKGTTKICSPDDLPIVIHNRSKVWKTYNMNLARELERFFVAAGMPTWIQADDDEYWKERVQLLWSQFASRRAPQ